MEECSEVVDNVCRDVAEQDCQQVVDMMMMKKRRIMITTLTSRWWRSSAAPPMRIPATLWRSRS